MHERSTAQQTEKCGAKFKILKCLKQTLSPFPQQSTLSAIDSRRNQLKEAAES
jgi:hypothetical protein